MINQWLNGVLGLVIIGVPFLNLSEVSLMWTLVAVGVVVAVNSFWILLVDSEMPESSHSSGRTQIRQ